MASATYFGKCLEAKIQSERDWEQDFYEIRKIFYEKLHRDLWFILRGNEFIRVNGNVQGYTTLSRALSVLGELNV